MTKPAKITRAYVRHYRDNGQTTAYVEFSNGSRVEGSYKRLYHPSFKVPLGTFGIHMHSLMRRAKHYGVRLERETW